MGIKKIVIPSLLIVFCLMFNSSQVFAHTLKVGSSSSAVYHVTPDDSPVLGQKSTLSFDIKSESINEQDYYFAINLTKPDGKLVQLGVVANDSVVSGDYVFSQKGIYKIDLVATNAQTQSSQSFSFSQNVSRDSDDGIKLAIYLVAGFLILLGAVFVRSVFKYNTENNQKEKK